MIMVILADSDFHFHFSAFQRSHCHDEVIYCWLQRCCWLNCLCWFWRCCRYGWRESRPEGGRSCVNPWPPLERRSHLPWTRDRQEWRLHLKDEFQWHMFVKRDIKQFYPVKKLLLAHWTIDPWCGRGLNNLRAGLRSQQVHLVTILVKMIMIIMVMMMMVVVAVVLSSMAMGKDCRINKFTWLLWYRY